MSRNTKTPARRAQEALDLASRHVARLTAKWERLAAEAADVEIELTAAKVRRDYLAQHPDLDDGPNPLGRGGQITTEGESA